ncbi:hypothetical protein NQ317_012703, partial [Molorchus minor]
MKPDALLYLHLKRAHYLAFIWENAQLAEVSISPKDNGLKPVLTTLPPATSACIEIVFCSCKTSLCTSQLFLITKRYNILPPPLGGNYLNREVTSGAKLELREEVGFIKNASIAGLVKLLYIMYG